MHAVERSIGECRALVIDGNPTSRSILTSQLRDFGLQSIVQCGRVHDARRHLEVREFDIVLCEQRFPGEEYSGQDLLDDLRRAQLLPFSTVFIMITGEAAYDKVAEAAESALDGYLLKPHTATSLGARLKQARQRKKSLREIFEATEEGEFEQAARLCLQRFQARGPHWLYAARIGAELLLRLDRVDAAQKLYEAVIEAQALPWARLGVARAQIEGNQPAQARRTLESLIAEDPSYADAYDVMGRVQVEQGKLDEALNTYRQASELTPGSITRMQKQGMLAFYMGERDEAARVLERVAMLGISSKMFDHQSLVLLAFTRFHQRDSKGLQRCLDNLQYAADRASDDRRLQRFVQVVKVFGLMLQKQVAAVVGEVKHLAGDIRSPDFDVEAACNMLSLLSQLTAAELRLEAAERWTDEIALRFSTSKGLSELLARTAESHPPFADRVRQAHAKVTSIAEQCMAHTLNGDPRSTVKALIAQGRSTLNAKLIDMARLTLTRHQQKIAAADELQSAIDELRERYATSALASPLRQDSGRQAGGIALRAQSSADAPQRTASIAVAVAEAPPRAPA